MALPWQKSLGAHPRGDGTTLFRVWAPRAQTVHVRSGGEELALAGVGPGEAGGVKHARGAAQALRLMTRAGVGQHPRRSVLAGAQHELIVGSGADGSNPRNGRPGSEGDD